MYMSIAPMVMLIFFGAKYTIINKIVVYLSMNDSGSFIDILIIKRFCFILYSEIANFTHEG